MASKKNQTSLSELLAGVLFAVAMVIMLIFTGFWYLVFQITPQADLPRNYKGEFLVTIENYNNWHTHSRLFHSTADGAKLADYLVIRSAPKVVETCNKIKHCDKYESKFYALDNTQVDTYIIAQQDDEKFNAYIKQRKQSMDSYNRQITSFETKVEFEAEPLEGIFNRSVDIVENTSKKANLRRHNNAVRFAKNSCRKNGKGCGVSASLEYSYFGFPSIAVEVRRNG